MRAGPRRHHHRGRGAARRPARDALDRPSAGRRREPARRVRGGRRPRRRRPPDARPRPASHAPSPSGRFVISVEIDPPRSIRIDRTLEAARLLRDAGADVVNISTPRWRGCAWARWRSPSASSTTLDLECVVHVTTRDRNLMALESELLGAHALGVRNILALTGDPPRVGDYPTGTGVWDVDSIGLIEILARLNRGEDQAGSPIGQRASFTIACALDPTAHDAATEWDRLERKLAAGAHLVMTQPLYDVPQVEAMLAEARRRFGPRGLPGPGAAGRPAAGHHAPRGVPPQRGPRHHDPGRGARADADGRRRRDGGRDRDGGRAAGGGRGRGGRHLPDAELRAVRAGGRAGPADPRPPPRRGDHNAP